VRIFVLSLCIAMFVGAGCGYSVLRYDGRMGDVRSVAIATPRNDSFEPGVEYMVADALRREFLRRHAVRVVDDPSRADLVLGGRVASVESAGRSFSSVLLTLEYQITLALDLEAKLNDGSVVPIDPRALRETERYLASADLEAMRKNRTEALRDVATVLAGRVYDALYETLTP